MVGSTELHIEDSDMIGTTSLGYSGLMDIGAQSSVTISRSRIIGSAAPMYGKIARLQASGATLRISESILVNSSGKWAISDQSGDDFAVQLDTNVFDDTFDIYSTGKVLVQNCKGLDDLAAAKNASVATCDSTSAYCLDESCLDASIGIDCICEYNGVEVPFPSDCMRSAVLAVPVPSLHTLTNLVRKPQNETSEFVIANVRARLRYLSPGSVLRTDLLLCASPAR